MTPSDRDAVRLGHGCQVCNEPATMIYFLPGGSLGGYFCAKHAGSSPSVELIKLQAARDALTKKVKELENHIKSLENDDEPNDTHYSPYV